MTHGAAVWRPAVARANRPRRAAAARAVALLAAAAVLGAGPGSPGVRAQALLPDGFSDRPVVGGLSNPVGIAFLPDGRLLVAEQKTGRVRVVVRDRLATLDPALVVPGVNGAGGERGLLGVAADPRWPAPAHVYVHYTGAGPDTTVRISRFTATGDLAFTGDGSLLFDPATRYDVLDDAPDEAPKHNGGTLRFGPDGMLYASLGEDDAPCAARDTSGLRGVILRLDVRGLPDGPGGPPPRSLIAPPDNPFARGGSGNARLVWALGLRNPFRFHVDPRTGDLFIADVGEASWDEIDRADRGGLDFGWPGEEGPEPFAGGTGCDGALPATPPIHAIDHAGRDRIAVIGAGVYRRPPGARGGFPADYEGDYFFADYYDGRLRRLEESGGAWEPAPPAPGQPDPGVWAEGLERVSDYLVGPDGALWYCRQSVDLAPESGEIRRIVHDSAAPDTVPRPRFAFDAPFPLPAPGHVSLAYTLAARARVGLALYDVRGRLVRTLVRPRTEEPGRRVEIWDGRDDDGVPAPTGVYLARLSVGGVARARRVLLVR